LYLDSGYDSSSMIRLIHVPRRNHARATSAAMKLLIPIPKKTPLLVNPKSLARGTVIPSTVTAPT